MNPSDFGADIFDPNDDQPAAKAPAPDRAPDAQEGETDASAPQSSDAGADEAKPSRKKARRKAPSRRRQEETDVEAAADLATPTDDTEVASEPPAADAAPEFAEAS
ncbi:MAG: hypothetical protein RL562_3217, partial [Planctomycetota bacterium]